MEECDPGCPFEALCCREPLLEKAIQAGGGVSFGRRTARACGLGLLLNDSPDGIALVGPQGRIQMVNPAGAAMFGYEAGELIGQAIEMLVPQRYRSHHIEVRRAYAEKPSARPLGGGQDFPARRKDGSEFSAEISLTPLETDEGLLVLATIRDVTQRKKLQRDLRQWEVELLAAQQIQNRLLPRRPPELPGYDIAGASYPAQYTGGDYFDFQRFADGTWGLIVGDVSGHGLGPALLMASTHSLMRALVCTGPPRRPDELLRCANTALWGETDEEHFVTLVLACIDPAVGTFSYASAGHPTGFWLGSQGEIKALMESSGPPLGIFAQADFETKGPFVFQPGDLLLLVTDGLSEAQSATGDFFGTDHALDLIRACRLSSAGEILLALEQAVRAFSAEGKLVDDLTMLLVKVEQPAPRG